MGNRLYRSRDDRMIAGVAGGLAEYLGVDSALVRLVWAVLVLAGGFGALLYVVAVIVIPEEDDVLEDAAASGTAPGAASGTAPGAAAGTSGNSTAAAGGSTSATTSDWRSQRAAERAVRRDGRREARATRRAARGADPRTASIVIGAVLVIAGAGFLIHEYVPAIDFDWVWPSILIAIGILVLVNAFRPAGPSGPDRPA
jgi:phage shock protein C